MIDSFMGLSAGDNFYLASRDSSVATNKDYLNVYFQQSFNKMLSDITGGNDDDQGGLGQNDPFASFGNGQMFSGSEDPFQGMNGLSASSNFNVSNNDPFAGLLTDPAELQSLVQINNYAALIDKTVSYRQPGTGKLCKGQVEKVVLEELVPYLLVSGTKVTLDAIESLQS